MDPESNVVVASSHDVPCPTCSAEVGKRCRKLFPDWAEDIPHATRVEVASRLAPPESFKVEGDQWAQKDLSPAQAAAKADPYSETLLPPMEDLFTRRRSSRNEASRRYSCEPCGAPEVYRAVGNVPKHAHLCEDCWLDCTPEEREHYERLGASQEARDRLRAQGVYPKHDPQTGRPRPRVMRRSTEVMGFSTLTIFPNSTSLTVVCPQWVVKPTHLYILVRSGERLQVSNLRIGHYEQLMAPVPVELFRPLSDEVVAELARKHEGDEDVFLAALSQHCRVDMGIAQIGYQIALGIKNPTDHEAVVDAAIKVSSNREVY